MSPTRYKGLPSGYTKLNYIEATGTQYIICNYINDAYNNPYRIKAQFQCTAITNTSMLFGSAESDGNFNSTYFGIEPKTAKWLSGRIERTGSAVRFGVLDTSIHSVEWVYLDCVYFDANAIQETSEQSGLKIRSGHPFAIFGRFRGTSRIDESTLFSGRLFSFEFHDESGIARQYIPAMRESDGELGLYEVITDTFLTNSGTGTFIGG